MARRFLLTPTEWLLGLFLAALVAAFAVPEVQTFLLRRKRAEVGWVLVEMQTAIAHGSKPTPFGPVPQAITSLGTHAVSWPEGTLAGFTPPLSALRGTYTLTKEGSTWRLYGYCDVDGDGVPARYTATLDGPVTRLTDPNIY